MYKTNGCLSTSRPEFAKIFCPYELCDEPYLKIINGTDCKADTGGAYA